MTGTSSSLTSRQTAKVALFKDDGRVLVLRDKRGHWDFPGGEKDKKDRNVEACAKRETREETGLNVKTDKLKYIGRQVIEGKLRSLFATSVKGNPKPKLSSEHTDYKWVEPETLPHKKMKPQAKKLLGYCRDKVAPKKKLPKEAQLILAA